MGEKDMMGTIVHTRAVGVDSLDKDERELARLGYKQEFRREFSPLQAFGMVFSMFGLFPSISSVLVYTLPNGGPVSLVWGWAICAFFILLVATTLGELGSAAPTSGGLYWWTFNFASPRYRKLLSWIVGYSNTIGLIAGMASGAWGCAVQIMAAVSIGSGMKFSATAGQTYAVYVLVLITQGCVASLGSKIVARLQTVYIILNLLLVFAIIVAIPASTPDGFKNTASYAFSGFVNETQWPDGFSFVLGFLGPLWVICAFDSSLHMSEETTNAKKSVPMALVGATALAGILGWGINVVLAFRMGTDIESIMASPIGQPMAVILFNSFGQTGTLIVWSFVIVVQYVMGTSCCVATSRQTFAFARDGGLPFARYLYRINSYTQTPVNCAWFTVTLSALLGLLAFAGESATSAFFSLCVIGLYVAYTLPVLSRFYGGRGWTPGPFTLGKWGKPVGLTAVAWMIFSLVILVFPSEPKPTGAEMNYTIVVLGGWFTICLGYYFMPKYGGMYWFTGPISNLDTADSVHTKDSNVEGDEKYDA